MFKRPKARVRKSTNPMVLFDYRCYTKDGRIGKDFDPTLRQCLAKLSKMTAEQVQKEYGFPDLGQAEALQQRASGEYGVNGLWVRGLDLGGNLTATGESSCPTTHAPCVLRRFDCDGGCFPCRCRRHAQARFRVGAEVRHAPKLQGEDHQASGALLQAQG